MGFLAAAGPAAAGSAGAAGGGSGLLNIFASLMGVPSAGQLATTQVDPGALAAIRTASTPEIGAEAAGGPVTQTVFNPQAIPSVLSEIFGASPTTSSDRAQGFSMTPPAPLPSPAPVGRLTPRIPLPPSRPLSIFDFLRVMR